MFKLDRPAWILILRLLYYIIAALIAWLAGREAYGLCKSVIFWLF